MEFCTSPGTALLRTFSLLVFSELMNRSIWSAMTPFWDSLVLNLTWLLFFLQHKCYIVATVDKELKRRIRKIPGVPIMYISRHRWGPPDRKESCPVQSLTDSVTMHFSPSLSVVQAAVKGLVFTQKLKHSYCWEETGHRPIFIAVYMFTCLCLKKWFP